MNNLNLANSTLRKAWERLVESKLFNGVVERFQNEVKTLKLKEVRITEDDWKLIDNEMSELSSKEHDESEAEMRSDLTFDTIKERIEIIEKYIVELKERKKEINKKHKE